MPLAPDPFAPPIGMLAGNGRFPVEVARAIEARGGSVAVIGIDGQASTELEAYPLTRVGWGEIGRILATLRAAGCREIVIVGGVTRPDLARLRPDLGFFRHLPKLVRLVMSGGDDGVLRAVVRFLEAEGFSVVSPADIAPELVMAAGSLGVAAPSSDDAADMLLGSRVVTALGGFDIGQGVVVSKGHIEAIEAVEGTDRMIERVLQQRSATGTAATRRGGVLVKRPKPAQEMRVDLPAIGPDTVTKAARAGLNGISVLAGQTLVADRAETTARADGAGVFVYGFTDADPPARQRRDDGWQAAAVERLGGPQPGADAIRDARFGAAALARLAAFSGHRAVVVRHGHVLGVEPTGDYRALFARTAKLTQWGEKRWRRRIGVGVLDGAARIDGSVIEAAVAARLAGIALIGATGRESHRELTAAAAAAHVFLIRLSVPNGERA